MCSYFIRRGQCRAEPSRCIRTAHLLSWEDWPSQKRNKTCAYAVAFTAKHRHYHTTTAHTNKREDRSSFWLMLCVGTLNLFFFFNSIFVFFVFLKKKNQISSSSSSTYFACRAKHEWLWREKENSYTWNHWQEEGKQRPTLFLRLYRHALSSSGLKRHHHHWQ